MDCEKQKRNITQSRRFYLRQKMTTLQQRALTNKFVKLEKVRILVQKKKKKKKEKKGKLQNKTKKK